MNSVNILPETSSLFVHRFTQNSKEWLKSSIRIQNKYLKNETPVQSLIDLFQNVDRLRGLLSAYQYFQVFCSRDGKLSPEIGSAREKAFVAWLKQAFPEQIDSDIPNEKKEDVIFQGRQLSIKHSSNKKLTRNGIKVVWTVNENSRLKFKEHFCLSCDLVIIYVRFDASLQSGNVEILYIIKEELQRIGSSKSLEEILHELPNNSRGVEFTQSVFDDIKKNCEFHIQIDFDQLPTVQLNVIELLTSFYETFYEDLNVEQNRLLLEQLNL